jgi:nucleoside-diphosphate-sugar epimerase
MKVLIYGSNGWIGSQVIDLLSAHTVVKGVERGTNIEDLEAEIKTVNPTHIMSFIGRTHGSIDNKTYTTIDYLEQKGKIKENVRDNLYSPVVLAVLATKYKIHFTYMGTGCIFEYDELHPEGDENSGFDEADTPNFFGSGYSVVKGYTDKLMHLFTDYVLNVRIRMPITADYNPRNFITKIINYEKICSMPNSMTVLPDLLPAMIDMAENKITGTINLTNPGLITHNEILTMYKEIVNEKFTWGNFSAEEQNKILAAGRSNNCLDTKRLESLYPNVLDIKSAVKKCLEQMATSNKN